MPHSKLSSTMQPVPGRTRGGARGRQLDSLAFAELERLLGDAAQTRDQLIEHLHTLQDHFGHLTERHLRALAQWMNLPMAAVFETASFYAHFRIVRDGDPAPPPLTIRVCDSLSCQLAGAVQLHAGLAAGLDPAKVSVVRAPCMGRCETAPIVEVGHRHVNSATIDRVSEIIASQQFDPEIMPWPGLQDYLASGGYALLSDCRAGKLSVESLSRTLEEAGLRGLGGAGFPTFRKWAFVRAEPAPRYMVINADEGEPGTFKDRWYLEREPHRFLEGALVSAWAIEAAALYIYLRDEYPGLHEVLHHAIAELESAGLVAPGYIVLRRGAGAYICGEESALIESLEGKPGKPRHRPPFVAQKGLFDRPTLVNNVETVLWIPTVHSLGAQHLSGQGRNGRKGLRSFSVSGRVSKPGVHLAPAGISLNELLTEYCGGMLEGHALLAYLPGGASGGILPASLANLPLDFDTLQAHGCFIGSAAVMVLSDKDDLRAVATNLMAFFADESCGQCTPCRAGTEKMLTLLARDAWDATELRQLSQVMQDASICGLGQAAPNPVLNLLQYFPTELARQGVRISNARNAAAEPTK